MYQHSLIWFTTETRCSKSVYCTILFLTKASGARFCCLYNSESLSHEARLHACDCVHLQRHAAPLPNQARLLAAHQARSLLKFLTHALGMSLRPVIYPSQVSLNSVAFSGSVRCSLVGKLECSCQSPAGLTFSSAESNYSNNQTLCIT